MHRMAHIHPIPGVYATRISLSRNQISPIPPTPPKKVNR